MTDDDVLELGDDDVTVEVQRCAIHPCIGACDAGKTTCLEHRGMEPNVRIYYAAYAKVENARVARVMAERQAREELLAPAVQQRADEIMARTK